MSGFFIMEIMALEAIYLETLIRGKGGKILMAFKARAASAFWYRVIRVLFDI
jgi:hypothetical protein